MTDKPDKQKIDRRAQRARGELQAKAQAVKDTRESCGTLNDRINLEPDVYGFQFPNLNLFSTLQDIRERQQQLKFIQEFFQSPEILEIKEAPVESSSTAEEIDRHKAELEYRIKVLEALLKVFKAELKMLSNTEKV